PVQVVGGVIAVIVTLAFVLAFSGLLAIATRNPALPMLVGLVYFVLETFAANLGQWRELHLELLRGSLPIASVTALLADSLDPAHYGIGPPISDPSYVDRPLLLSFIVVAAWAGVFVVLADLLLRRADISD
ncbi:MAG: hypothetical protein ACRDGQ_12920, partial [Candidatus Limnocylindrales bacterium]